MGKFNRLVVLDVGFGSARPFMDLFKSKTRYHRGIGFEKGDILIFEGGTDINPEIYGEKPGKYTQRPDSGRDNIEIDAFNLARDENIPMIGICRGAQLFTALLGGKLIQHVNGHMGNHEITTKGGKILVSSSCHHQMMVPPREHELLAIANQQDPEVVFYPQAKALAIQGHPEWHHGNDPYIKYCNELVSSLLI